MKRLHVLSVLAGALLMGCNPSMFRGGYSDELYYIPGRDDSAPVVQNQPDDERRIETTDNSVYPEDEDSRVIRNTYEPEDSRGHAYFSFSIGGPGFYAGFASPMWGGWYYPYYGPYARYRWDYWGWDMYWYNPFYAGYWYPFWYNPWYYHNYWWGYPYAYWFGPYNSSVRETLSHRQGLITHRPDDRGSSIRPGGLYKQVGEQLRPGSLQSQGLRPANSRPGLRPDNRPSNDGDRLGNRTDGTSTRPGGRHPSSASEAVAPIGLPRESLSNDISETRITHTREPKPAQREISSSTTKPIRSDFNIGGAREVFPSNSNPRPSGVSISPNRPENATQSTVTRPSSDSNRQPSQNATRTTSEPRVIRSNTESTSTPSRNSDSSLTPSRPSAPVGGGRSSGSQPTGRPAGNNNFRK